MQEEEGTRLSMQDKWRNIMLHLLLIFRLLLSPRIPSRVEATVAHVIKVATLIPFLWSLSNSSFSNSPRCIPQIKHHWWSARIHRFCHRLLFKFHLVQTRNQVAWLARLRVISSLRFLILYRLKCSSLWIMLSPRILYPRHNQLKQRRQRAFHYNKQFFQHPRKCLNSTHLPWKRRIRFSHHLMEII